MMQVADTLSPGMNPAVPYSDNTDNSPAVLSGGRSIAPVMDDVPLSSPVDENSVKAAPGVKKTSLAKRLALPFKTAANNFVRWGLDSALLLNFAGGLTCGTAGAVVTTTVALPIAGVIKLGEMLTGSKKMIAGKFLGGSCLAGLFAGGLVGGVVAAPPAVLAGVGIGLAAGAVGLLQGAKNACKKEMPGIKPQHSILKPFFDRLQEKYDLQEKIKRRNLAAE